MHGGRLIGSGTAEHTLVYLDADCPQGIADLIGTAEWTPYAEPVSPSDEPAPLGSNGTWIEHTWTGRSWLAGPHLVRANTLEPELAAAEDDRGQWLRNELGEGESPSEWVTPGWLAVARPPGAPAHKIEAHPRPDAIPAALGRTMRRLHDLDATACPFTRPREDLVTELQLRVDGGQLAPELLPAPYDRYPADRLLELIDVSPIDAAQSVVCHGAPVLSNFWIVEDEPSAPATATLTGLQYLGLGDYHGDLAVIHRQLHTAYGPDSVFAFYEAYERDPHLVALDHYLLIDTLRAALVDPGWRGSRH